MSLSLHAFEVAEDLPALHEFLELPFRVYADDPNWIPVFRETLAARLCGSPLEPGHRWRCFLARRGGEPVARCVASINPALTSDEGPSGTVPVGTIGSFEALDDAEAIAALLSAARAWLGAEGQAAVWGPFDFSIFHPYRFMTRGFAQRTFFGEPYNPPYYPERWRDAGFVDLGQWYSWDLHKPHLDAMHQMSFALRSDALTGGGYTYRPFDVGAGFERDLRCAYDVLLPSFAPNLASTPISFPTFAEAYGPLRTFVRGELAPLVVDPAGEVVGLGFLYPDPGEAFRALGGELARLGELPGLLAATPPQSLVFHTMAVLKEHRRKGLIEAYFAQAIEHAFAAGITGGVGALAKEGPTIYDKTGPSSRQYTLFRYGG